MMLGAGVMALVPLRAARAATTGTEGGFEITRSEAEWRAMLSDLEYAVMREEGTERAGSSPLDKLY
ncbi:MAG TPA: peptide-methionine (R)-S-oxide reductase, partial [Roseovarius nubinhibens]|nr:peptide-methionine (R)-S-oxide reductase [Roseovarius nubinhibens]